MSPHRVRAYGSCLDRARSRHLWPVVAAWLAIAAGAIPPAATAATTRISIGESGQADRASQLGAASGSGTIIAFESDATNLVPGDTNARADIFVRDTSAGTTQRVSVSTYGAQANGESFCPSISLSGSRVVFLSSATNLDPSAVGGRKHVYLRDRSSGVTTPLSRSSTGFIANGDSASASISADGNFVAFESQASNLVAGDTNGSSDIFVRDIAADAVTRVSVATDGSQANGDSSLPGISSDGRYVVFL